MGRAPALYHSTSAKETNNGPLPRPLQEDEGPGCAELDSDEEAERQDVGADGEAEVVEGAHTPGRQLPAGAESRRTRLVQDRKVRRDAGNEDGRCQQNDGYPRRSGEEAPWRPGRSDPACCALTVSFLPRRRSLDVQCRRRLASARLYASPCFRRVLPEALSPEERNVGPSP